MEALMNTPVDVNFSTTNQFSLLERWKRYKETMQLYLKLSIAKSTEKEQ